MYKWLVTFILLTFFPLLNEEAEILPVGFNVMHLLFVTWGERGSELVRVTSCLAGLSQTVHQVITLEFLPLPPQIASLAEGFLSVRLCFIYFLFVHRRAPDNKYAAGAASTEHNRLCSQLFPPQNSSASFSVRISTHLLISHSVFELPGKEGLC